MALPNTFFLFVLFLFFHFSFFMSFTTNAVPKLVDEVCHHAKNYDFCVMTLTFNPGNNNINTPTGLARVSLLLTSQAIYENNDFIYNSLQTVRDPGVKRVLELCKTNYGASVAAIALAFQSLNEGKYYQLDGNVFTSYKNSLDCDRAIKQGPPPPGLQDRNNELLQFTDISMLIADYLFK